MLRGEKPKLVEDLKRLINTYSVIGLLNMHSLPAKQLQQIKTDLKGVATIKMSKKSLIKKALEGSEKNVKVLEEKIVGEPAMIFSNEDPFRLFKILKENRSSAPARLGDVAPHDIIIPKGPTGIPPGPAISTLQKVGLKTTVDKGKIAVAADRVVVKEGEVVKEDAVNALNLLKIEPMEIGLDLISAWQDEKIYNKSVLDIDTDEYINNIGLAVQQMINISLNTGYLVPETAKMALQKAFIEAKELAIAANILDKDVIGELLLKAVSEARALDALVPEVKEEKPKEEEKAEKPKEDNSSDKKEVEK
jgi:large subunit ribosomal protein L10